MSLWIQTGCMKEEEVESKMYEGGKFQKAEAAKEEPGEKDAPPSYAAYRGCIIKRRDTPKKHERGCCWGRVRRRF